MSNIISFFQKLIKGGVGIRAGGLENFSKINKRRGDDYSVLESIASILPRIFLNLFAENHHLRSAIYILITMLCILLSNNVLPCRLVQAVGLKAARM